MHSILFYEYVPEVLERRGPFREAHLARIRAEKEAGRVVMAGALGDPVHGAAIVFEDVDDAEVERFAESDPDVEGGLIEEWRIEPWTVV